MKTIELNEGTVNAHYELMTNPQKYNLKFRPIAECFEPTDEPTGQHLLFADYHKEVPMCPKIFFYIVMEKVYGPARDKDKDGNLGFKLRFIEAKND